MTDKEEIQKLKSGERYIVPESDYGKAEVWRVNNHFILFEIPLYGGEPMLHDTYRIRDIDMMINEFNSWT